ncbi:hypothetical protein ALC57_14240, partial [Trachymyrmex cornetzi]
FCIHLTDNVKSPGFEELGRAKNELSTPRSINKRSASKPLQFMFHDSITTIFVLRPLMLILHESMKLANSQLVRLIQAIFLKLNFIPPQLVKLNDLLSTTINNL